jgi:hypothetical protein
MEPGDWTYPARGTEGSNSVSSSGESVANRFLPRGGPNGKPQPARADGLGRAARRRDGADRVTRSRRGSGAEVHLGDKLTVSGEVN